VNGTDGDILISLVLGREGPVMYALHLRTISDDLGVFEKILHSASYIGLESLIDTRESRLQSTKH